ncbi:MAG: hypothetical protein Q9224_002403 [Gallowayella concinna]
MDINQLIDSDASGSASNRPAKSSSSRNEVEKQSRHPQEIYQSPRRDDFPGARQHREQRPPQPPPLRPPLQQEFRSASASSYNSMHSPYQKTPSSALSTGQYPFPQPLIHSPQAINDHQRESQSFAANPVSQTYGHISSLPQTPTSITPGSSYPSFQAQRPPSSHSASTPTSGHTQTPTFLRDSPQQSHAQLRGSYGPNPNHHYLSQPGTPLGPPTTIGRQSSALRRESPSSIDHKRRNSGGSHGQQQQTIQSPTNIVQNPSVPSPMAYATPHIKSPPEPKISTSQDRERSISVSPKTKVPIQPPLSSIRSALDANQTPSVQVTTAKRKIGDSRVDESLLQQQPSAKRSMSLGVGAMLNASNDDDNLRNSHKRSLLSNVNYAHLPPQGEVPDPHSHEQSSHGLQPGSISHSLNQGGIYPTTTSSPTQTPFAKQPMSTGPGPALLTNPPSQVPSTTKQPFVAKETPSVHPPSVSEPSGDMAHYRDSIHNKTNLPLSHRSSSSQLSKPWKQFRGKVPIFAQSARQNGRAGPSNNNRRQAIRKSPSPLPSVISQQSQNAALNPSAMQVANGHGSIDEIRSNPGPAELLGPWEPAITNIIPSDELIRAIMNWLVGIFHEMSDVILDMVEIEAKIGILEDKNTGGRVRIPVETECIVNRNNPNLQAQFKSSMTMAQHAQLNEFLNKAVIESSPLPPNAPPRLGRPRVPLVYARFKQTDTFYDLSPNALNTLPPVIQNYLDRRNAPKVRITTEQGTGKEVARIIKVKVANIEVYCPRTLFDWRVSVNLEMKWDGDVKDLVKSTEGKEQRNPERKKNRLSYKQGPYQMDLTQVEKIGANAAIEKEHELEIELSTTAVREQIHRVLTHQPDAYEDLIKGFVDNVRTVVRHCKE